MSEAIFMTGMNLDAVAAWATSRVRHLPQACVTGSNSCDVEAALPQSNLHQRSNEISQQRHQRRKTGCAKFGLVVVAPNLVITLALAAGFALIVFHFVAGGAGKKNLLVSALLLLVVGMIITSLKEWLCAAAGHPTAAGCQNRDRPPNHPTPPSTDGLPSYESLRPDKLPPPAYRDAVALDDVTHDDDDDPLPPYKSRDGDGADD